MNTIAKPVMCLLCLLIAGACTPTENPEDSGTQTEERKIDVSLHEGTNMAVALSPDKQTLALDLQGTIWIMSVSGGSATPLTNALGDCHEPAWSPDGMKIAFHSYKSGNYHIWTINKDGSGLTQITDGIYDDREPDWMPDGNTLVFSSDRNGNYDIFKIKLASNEIEALTNTEGNDYNPAVSLDGEQIAFVSEREEKPGIYSISNGKESLIASTSGKSAAPSWSENGAKILFASFIDGNSTLQSVDVASGSVTAASTEGEDIFPFRAAWLSDSSFLYTSDGSIKKRILDGEGFETIAFEATVTLNRPEYARKQYDFDSKTPTTPLGIMGPVISPDGTKVAFTALGNIHIQEIGGEITQLTDDPYIDIDPEWSPDGSQLVFASDRGGKMDLWIRDLQTGEDKKITDTEESAGYPAWSPDGKKIAFYAFDARNVWGYGTLQLLDLASGNVKPIHNPLFVPGKPSWSVDGKTLALMALDPYSSRYREGISKIMTLTLATGDTEFQSPEEGRTPAMRGQNGPLWSPDGTTMAYIQDGVLWTIGVDAKGKLSGEPKQLTEELASKPSWTADSKSLLYMATDRLKLIQLEDSTITDVEIDLEWSPEIPEENYVVYVGRLFDGKSEQYLENMDIVVEGNRITAIEPHQDEREGTVIDASDKVVIPGLFEMHTHQHASAGEKLGRTWLSYGITSVREPGADPYDALERKESWASGVRSGPREFFAGGLTDGSRVYYGLANSVIHSPHMNLELNRAKLLGYDMIKTYVRMPDSLQQLITEAAHEMGIPVSSHEIYPSTKYNVDAVEHIRGTSRRGYSMKQTEMSKTYDDVVQLLVSSGMNITPTIGLQGGFFLLTEKYPELLENRQFQNFYSKSYQESMASGIERIKKIYPGYGANFDEIEKSINTIVNAGGRLTAGTDSPFIPYGTSLHTELQLFVEAGLTPFQALQSATIRSAEAVGVADDLGSVEEGKLADFVIINGDPLTNIRDAWNVETVFKNGIKYEIEDLLQGP